MDSYPTEKIRSFALVGHGGCGKTSMAEGLAYLTGQNTRLGSVTDHTSIMDFEPEEQKRGGSMMPSFLTCEFEGFKTHVADTPGDGNFVHCARTVLQGVDAAVIVVSAVDGVEVSTEFVTAYAKALEVPRAVFINKMDRENADIEGVMAELKSVLGLQPVLMQIPVGKDHGFRGVVDLVEQKAYLYTDDKGRGTPADIPAELADEVSVAVEQMMEAVASSDDDLIEKYLDAGELSEEELLTGLAVGIRSGAIVPVLLGSAARNIGMDKLLHFAHSLPSANEHPPVLGHEPGNPDESIERHADPNGPFAAQVIHTMVDRVGTISVLRLVSGTATGDTPTINPRTKSHERFGMLMHLAGNKRINIDKALPGDLFAVAKLKDADTGDTLCDPHHQVELPFEPPPPGMISYTVTPKSRSDVDKLKAALGRLLAEDPGLRQTQDAVTHELVLSGQGASHVQLSVEKLARKFGVSVDLGTPAIPYKETIYGSADVRYRHKKQTGGAGQFGEVAIRVGPAQRGAGFVFVNAIKGGVIPGALIPSVERGVRDKLASGILAGHEVVDVQVELYDGKYHPVDSKDIAFQIAGRQAIKEAVLKARPGLLEPIYELSVVAPEDLVGDVMGDLNSRRGRILNMENRGRNTVVKALVPLAEVLAYAPDLRSMTGGKGSYTMQFHAYEPLPSHLQEKVVAEANHTNEEE